MVIFTLSALTQLAPAQVPRKAKEVQPPSYDEVMQRALSEKKSASNAPASSTPASTAVPAREINLPKAPAVTASKPAISADALLQEAKSAKSQPALPPPDSAVIEQPAKPQSLPRPPASSAITAAPKPATPATVVRPEQPQVSLAQPIVAPAPPAPIPAPVAAPKSAKRPAKGPVFSPLPPDLAPTNEVQQARY